MAIVFTVVLIVLGLAGVQMMLSYQKRYAKLLAQEGRIKRHMMNRIQTMEQEVKATHDDAEIRLEDSRTFVASLRGKISGLEKVINELEEQISKELSYLGEDHLSKDRPEVVNQITLSQIKAKYAIIDDQLDYWESSELSVRQQLERIDEKLAHLVEQIDGEKTGEEAKAKPALGDGAAKKKKSKPKAEPKDNGKKKT